MTSLERLKQDNEKLILKVIHQNPGIYRKLVAKETNLASQTVTNLVTEMLDKKRIVETYNKADGRGRVPISLKMNYGELYLLTINLELDWISIYLHSLDETIIASDRVRVPKQGDIARLLEERIAVVLNEAGADYQLQAVVISVVGVVNEDKGTVVYARELNFFDYDLAERFSYLGVPVLVRNDANLIASYEKCVNKGSTNFMVAKLDHGIGSAFVLGSMCLKGSNNIAGELGHVTVASEEERACFCGKSNCLTTFISRRALEKSYGNSYEQLAQDAREGKEEAIALIRRLCDYLAPILANMIGILDLDHVVLCGCTVENFLEIIRPHLETKIKERLSCWTAFKGLKVHTGIHIVAISTQFWTDYFFSTETVRGLL